LRDFPAPSVWVVDFENFQNQGGRQGQEHLLKLADLENELQEEISLESLDLNWR
jgi:hypothetical protein